MTARHSSATNVLIPILPLISSAALAAPITVDFTGTVTGRQNGVFAGQGDEVVGSFTYDLDMEATPGSDGPDFNRFQTGDLDNIIFDWEYTITNGDVTRSTRDFEGDAGSQKSFALVVVDQPFTESVSWSGNSSIVVGTPPNDFFLYNMFFEMELIDTEPISERDGVAPGSNNLTGDMPDLSSFDTSLFEARAGSMSITGPNSPGPANNLIGQLDFSIDTITNRVPEPSAHFMLLAGVAMANLWKRRPRRS